jgi:catecholate siderophore receptor
MGAVRSPRSLRVGGSFKASGEKFEIDAAHKVTVACLMAVGSISSAEAQQSSLPAVTVDAPVSRPRPAATRPTAEQLRVRAALRRAARQRQQTAAAPVQAPNSFEAPADRSPYADPNAPYKADRLSSTKFSEPILNTPKSITVLTKELLADKNATTLKEVARTTAGVTLGTGEGGNAFGDRFFIRGFDARNDVFVDGIRDPGVSIRENFFTEQVEILRGPASSYAGRGTAGGAINIVTKQAADRDFTNLDTTVGSDQTKRIVVDVNRVISPTLSVRMDAMGQGAKVAGRDYVSDDRWGALGALKWTPTTQLKVTASYIHTDLNQLPDFGVPWDRFANTPATETKVSRNTFYGYVNRDYQRTRQDIGTTTAEYSFSDALKLTNRLRAERSTLAYIGTLPEAPRTPADPTNTLVQLNPQSRFQSTTVVADQTDMTMKFDTGPVRHTAVFGTEFSRENIQYDNFLGLSSEALPGGANGPALQVPFGSPPNNLSFPNFNPGLSGNPTKRTVDTKSGYLIDTANINDTVILNGGVRYDDYNITASNNVGSNQVHSGIVSYNGGIVIKPVKWASVYAAYATSANPVGGELDGNTAQYGGLPASVATNTNQVFDPERNKAAEVGTKWELFDRRVLATAALFQTEKENARELGTIGGVANTVVAGASYRIQGIDLGLSGKITDKWSVYAGLVLMRSEVTKSNVASPNPALFPSNVGLQLANIAHESFNVLTKYKVTDRFELGGQATYRSKIYGGTLLAANQGTSLPSYWRFDMFAEYKVNKNLTVKLFVNNIFDKTYYDALYQSATPFVFVAPGRAAYLQASMKF